MPKDGQACFCFFQHPGLGSRINQALMSLLSRTTSRRAATENGAHSKQTNSI